MSDKGKKKDEAEDDKGSLTLKRKVVFRKEEEGVELRELDGIEKCAGAPLVEAFPHVGVTGLLAVQYIIDQLKLPMVGVVNAPHGLPTAVVMGSQPGPSIRVYGNEKLVAWVSETKLNEKSARALVKLFLDFAQRHKSKMVYLVEGVPSEDMKNIDRTKLTFLTTNEEMGKRLQDAGHEYLHEAVISGVTGGVVAEAPYIQEDVTCLLVPSSAYFPDASSALQLVNILVSLIGIEVDTAPLENKASFLESKVKKLMKLSSSGGPPAGMFG